MTLQTSLLHGTILGPMFSVWQFQFPLTSGIFAVGSLPYTLPQTSLLAPSYRKTSDSSLSGASTAAPATSVRIWISKSLWMLDQLVWITLDIDMLIESITKCYHSGHNSKVTLVMLMVIMGQFLQKLFTTSTKATQETVMM